MLDTRWFKTFNTEGAHGTMLGEEQWAWLETEFSKEADLRIVVTSIQYHGNAFEGWYELDCEQKRMLTILPDNVIFISGDRHMGSIYQLDSYNGAEYLGWRSWFDGRLTPPLTVGEGQNKPLFEATASGLNSALGGPDEPGPHRIPGVPITREDHFGTIEIDWDAMTVTGMLRYSSNGEPIPDITLTVDIPTARRQVRRGLRFGYQGDVLDNDDGDCPAPYSCSPWTGGDTTTLLKSLTGSVWFEAGSYPADPLLRETNVSVSAVYSGGEYTLLAQDSFWQVPANWVGVAFVSGPNDGHGIKMMGVVNDEQVIRAFENNEVSGGSSRAMTYMVSAVEDKGSLDGDGGVFPSADEMYSVWGAPLRYYDIALEAGGGRTTYEVRQSGIAIKRIYVSDGVDAVTLVKSREDFVAATTLQGPSRFCGGNFHQAYQYSTEEDGAGFADEIYIGGHEESAFGAVFVLDTITGSLYLLPMPSLVETAAPIYSGSADYVALALNVYPEDDGQHIHIWVGKKIADSDDFLARNGLHPAHGKRYVLGVDDGSLNWSDLEPQQDHNATFVPADEATNVFGTSGNKNEWSTVNKLSPTMWAQALTDDDNLAILSADVSGSGFDCTSTGGSALPCTVKATVKHLGVKELIDPAFGKPDSLYWSPRGALIIAEDGAQGRLLRLDLDADGQTYGDMRTLTRVADVALVTDLNSVPPMTIPDAGASQAEFSGIIPAGFFNKVGPTSTATELLAAELEAEREQYFVNLQLHGHVEGMIDEYKLGESTQMLRIDVDADAEDSGLQMYVWLGVGFYNGKREGYCSANDCSDMRGPYVTGEIVRVSDFAALEIWRELEPGTYTNDLDTIIAESLSFNNLEPALPYVWVNPSFYNGKREGYCSTNDCSDMRGPFVVGDIALESDFAVLEIWRELEPGTYTNDLDAIIAESLSFNNFEPAIPYIWTNPSFYNGKREGYCSANDCSEMRGPFVVGEVVRVSDFEALEIWRELEPGTYTSDLDAIIAESLSFNNFELAGF